jgi:hypothetical protein
VRDVASIKAARAAQALASAVNRQPAARPLSIIRGLLAAILLASVADTILALAARSAGASSAMQALHPSSYIPLTVLGVLAGSIGWAVVRRKAATPSRLLRVLVPVVLVVSFVPDLAMLAGGAPGSGPVGVAALMLMHLAVATTAVLAYRRVLPLPSAA